MASSYSLSLLHYMGNSNSGMVNFNVTKKRDKLIYKTLADDILSYSGSSIKRLHSINELSTSGDNAIRHVDISAIYPCKIHYVNSESVKAALFKAVPFLDGLNYAHVAVTGSCIVHTLIQSISNPINVDLAIYDSNGNASRNVHFQELLRYLISYCERNGLDYYINCQTDGSVRERKTEMKIMADQTELYTVSIPHFIYQDVRTIAYSQAIPCEAVVFDGYNVLMTDMGYFALEFRANIVNTDRYHDDYDIQLAHYLKKGFDIILPFSGMYMYCYDNGSASRILKSMYKSRMIRNTDVAKSLLDKPFASDLIRHMTSACTGASVRAGANARAGGGSANSSTRAGAGAGAGKAEGGSQEIMMLSDALLDQLITEYLTGHYAEKLLGLTFNHAELTFDNLSNTLSSVATHEHIEKITAYATRNKEAFSRIVNDTVFLPWSIRYVKQSAIKDRKWYGNRYCNKYRLRFNEYMKRYIEEVNEDAIVVDMSSTDKMISCNPKSPFLLKEIPISAEFDP